MTQSELKTEWLGFRCTKELKGWLIEYREEHGRNNTSKLIRDSIANCPVYENILFMIIPELSTEQIRIIEKKLTREVKKEFKKFLAE